MPLTQVCRGRWGSIVLAECASGDCPAAEFIADLEMSDKAKVKALLQRFADEGKIVNRVKFKKIADDLFEFKSFQIRLFCYITANQVVITHGAKKKRDDLNPADITRAKRIRQEHELIQRAASKIGKVQ
jgi:hypothetical protein